MDVIYWFLNMGSLDLGNRKGYGLIKGFLKFTIQ